MKTGGPKHLIHVDGKTISLPQSTIKELIEQVQTLNKLSSNPISIHQQRVGLLYNFNCNNNEPSVLLGRYHINNDLAQDLVTHGYIVLDHKLLFPKETELRSLRDILGNDHKVKLRAIAKLPDLSIQKEQRISWLKHEEQAISSTLVAQKYSLKINLYNYQLKGLVWLKEQYSSRKGALLADDMGLGKTAQAIAFLVDGFSRNLIQRVLIVVPNSLITNWSREITKFSKGLSCYVHWGNQRAGFPERLAEEEIVLTTYSTLTNDHTLFEQLQFDVVICDEASHLKNPDSQRTKAVNKLHCDFAIAITGTPFENSLLDLWSVTNFVNENYLGQLDYFKAEYCSVPLSDLSNAQLQNIEAQTNEIMLRRLKTDVLDDLPEKIDIHLPLTPHPREMAGYLEIVSKVKKSDEQHVLAMLSRLRKYTSHPFLCENGMEERTFNECCVASAKFEYLDQIVCSVIQKKEKAIVFANHIDLLDAFRELFERKHKLRCFKIDGTVAMQDRQQILDQFENVLGSALMFLNPVTAGMGLNITSANHVIHYSRQWNPALEDQATARCYRNGQPKSVNAYYLYYADTVEEVIHNRLFTKRDVAGSLIKPSLDDDLDNVYLDALREI